MRRFDRSHGAIHDLSHIGGLAATPCHLLCVSDRTLYILQNLAAEEVTYSARYATEFADGVYQTVDPDDLQWPIYTSAVENLQLEMMTMTCDIEAGLTAIADALAGMQSGCGNVEVNIPSGDCLATIPNEEHTYNDPLESGDEVGGDDPPDGFLTWEEYYAYKCQAAHYVWQILRNAFTATMGLSGLQLTSAIIVPVMAGFAGMLPAVFTPAGAALFVVGILTVAGLSIFALHESYQMVQYLDDNRDDIVCSLYEAGTSADAVTALSTVIEDAIQFIVWPAGLAGVSGALNDALGLAFSQLANNNVVEPLFKLIAGVTFPNADCSGCEQPVVGCEGLRTFDTDIEDTDDYSAVTLSWDAAQGHNALGSVKSINDAGSFQQGWTRWPCTAGITIEAGMELSLWAYPTGDPDQAHFVRVFCTDASYQDSAIFTNSDDWYQYFGQFDTLYGKTLEGLYFVSTNGNLGTGCINWFDDVQIALP